MTPWTTGSGRSRAWRLLCLIPLLASAATALAVDARKEKADEKKGVYYFRPFLGAAAGGWAGNLEPDATAGLQAGIYGPSIGVSALALYYDQTIRMVPIAFNLFFRYPIYDSAIQDLLTFRVGGGAAFLIYANPSPGLFASQANVGLDVWITRRIAVAVDAFYFFFGGERQSGEKANLDSALGLLSLKYRFR